MAQQTPSLVLHQPAAKPGRTAAGRQRDDADARHAVASGDVLEPYTDHVAHLPSLFGRTVSDLFDVASAGSSVDTPDAAKSEQPTLLAASGILASEYYAAQARAAEVLQSEEWVRTPSCNIARDETAAQGVCIAPDDPLAPVAVPASHGGYGAILGALAAAGAVAVMTAADSSREDRTTVQRTAASADQDGVASPLAAADTQVLDAAPIVDTAAQQVDAASASFGGAGNDVLRLDAAAITQLDASAHRGESPQVAGGEGMDTLSLVGGSVMLDIGLLRAAGVQFSSVESIDLTGSGNNTLVMKSADVLALSGKDLFNAGNGWAGQPEHVDRHQVVVEGNAGDVLKVESGWESSGSVVEHQGHQYAVFNAGNALAQLLVETQVSVVIG
ncbi:MAG: hypothetical protein JWP52_3410 [Rhizobacter sp.]|nr:hypothetical protein [Rhizobacter sp.]